MEELLVVEIFARFRSLHLPPRLSEDGAEFFG